MTSILKFVFSEVIDLKLKLCKAWIVKFETEEALSKITLAFDEGMTLADAPPLIYDQ